MPHNFEPKFGFSPNDPSFFETVFPPNAQTLEVWALQPYPGDIGVPLPRGKLLLYYYKVFAKTPTICYLFTYYKD